MPGVRILVTGGRDYTDADRVEAELKSAVAARLGAGVDPSQVVLVHGDAPGLDRLAAAAAKRLGFQVEAHPADWTGPCRPTCPSHRRRRRDGTDYCPAAGVYRNAEMVELGADLAIVFPGGKGTADCARRIRAAGIAVREVARLAA
ncbi:MAG: SLOG family protein [Actinomycetota bacterium]|jgi:hypothetical protein|nr:SLOG family protein [Actinomycetota bacterium]